MTAPDRRFGRALAALFAAVALALGGVLISPLAANAATLTVVSSADSGVGSLRAVIAASNPGDTIVFDPAVTTIALASTIEVDWGLTINGGGTVTITRANTSNFVQVYFGPELPDQDLTLQDISITGISGSFGAGLVSSYGDNDNLARDVTLRNVTMTGETFLYGAAFSAYRGLGNILIENSTFAFNTANGSDGGGAVDIDGVSGTFSIINSTFASNTSSGDGGAVHIRDFSFDTAVTVRNSTFEANQAQGDGGALYVGTADEGASITVDSSTFTGNSINGEGLGVSVFMEGIDGPALITNSTFDEQEPSDGFAIAGDVVGGSFEVEYSTIIAYGTVFLLGSSNATIVSSILDAGDLPPVSIVTGDPIAISYSLVSSSVALLFGVATDAGGNQFSVTDPKLGPLQNNGGPTFTRLPLAGSPAIDKGLPGGTPPAFDQRGTGFPRVSGGRVDIGAVEVTSALAATGQTISIWLPILGGILLLGGIAAVVVTTVRRRRLP